MKIISSDYARVIDVGSSEVWNALCATVKVLLSKKQAAIVHALEFMSSGVCESENCIECAKEINRVRDLLSQFSLDKIVYDETKKSFVPDWAKSISPVITSCANFFTTADGEDLLFEIVSILSYGGLTGHRVTVEN